MIMDYVEIIERFKKVFEENGAEEERDYPWFGPADKEQFAYLTDLY